ncbi:MAG: YggT family protein [Paracoccaceae bacterium]
MYSLFLIIMLVLNVVYWIILIHIIMSWLINFQVLNMRQPLVAQVWYGLNSLLEPMYRPIRRMLPNMGGIDIAPLVALVAIIALRIVIRENISAFY